MGNPDKQFPGTPSPLPTPVGESASSISLHTQNRGTPAPYVDTTERYFDDDPDEFNDNDLPPLYADHELDAPAQDDALNPLIPGGTAGLKVQPFAQDKHRGVEYYLDRRLDTDPVFLRQHLDHLAVIPPRPHVHIRGTHHENVRKADGRHERRDVVDFDIHIELTHLLYDDIQAQRPFHRETVTAGNFEKVRRGTIFATRAPGYGGSGLAEDGTPDLDDWCFRFCTSRSGLRNFVLEREVQGYDFELIRRKLEALIRGTNYRGRLHVTFPVQNGRVEVYNECMTNRWRLTKWIEMLFVFTLFFLFSWPWLFFRTARWEVVNVQWRMSAVDQAGRKRYAGGLSEERWYNMWARAIHKAVLDRRQGTLDQGDLARTDNPAAPQGGFAGAVQAGVEAMGVVNRSFGWGADE